MWLLQLLPRAVYYEVEHVIGHLAILLILQEYLDAGLKQTYSVHQAQLHNGSLP